MHKILAVPFRHPKKIYPNGHAYFESSFKFIRLMLSCFRARFLAIPIHADIVYPLNPFVRALDNCLNSLHVARSNPTTISSTTECGTHLKICLDELAGLLKPGNLDFPPTLVTELMSTVLTALQQHGLNDEQCRGFFLEVLRSSYRPFHSGYEQLINTCCTVLNSPDFEQAIKGYRDTLDSQLNDFLESIFTQNSEDACTALIRFYDRVHNQHEKNAFFGYMVANGLLTDVERNPCQFEVENLILQDVMSQRPVLNASLFMVVIRQLTESKCHDPLSFLVVFDELCQVLPNRNVLKNEFFGRLSSKMQSAVYYELLKSPKQEQNKPLRRFFKQTGVIPHQITPDGFLIPNPPVKPSPRSTPVKRTFSMASQTELQASLIAKSILQAPFCDTEAIHIKLRSLNSEPLNTVLDTLRQTHRTLETALHSDGPSSSALPPFSLERYVPLLCTSHAATLQVYNHGVSIVYSMLSTMFSTQESTLQACYKRYIQDPFSSILAVMSRMVQKNSLDRVEQLIGNGQFQDALPLLQGLVAIESGSSIVVPLHNLLTRYIGLPDLLGNTSSSSSSMTLEQFKVEFLRQLGTVKRQLGVGDVVESVREEIVMRE